MTNPEAVKILKEIKNKFSLPLMSPLSSLFQLIADYREALDIAIKNLEEK